MVRWVRFAFSGELFKLAPRTDPTSMDQVGEAHVCVSHRAYPFPFYFSRRSATSLATQVGELSSSPNAVERVLSGHCRMGAAVMSRLNMERYRLLDGHQSACTGAASPLYPQIRAWNIMVTLQASLQCRGNCCALLLLMTGVCSWFSLRLSVDPLLSNLPFSQCGYQYLDLKYLHD